MMASSTIIVLAFILGNSVPIHSQTTPVAGCVQGAIRLMGGANSMTGRVEICNRNIWGTVCDDFWGTSEAKVACRQLGFSDVGSVALTTGFTNGAGQIWLDNVDCHGTETRLIDCPAITLGIHNCIHTEDAGVRCLPYIDFGFSQSTFSGIEQGENYRIPIKFFSGGVEQGFIVNVNLNLSGTAGENDINLITTQLKLLPGTIQQNIEFSLRVDNIAQELDETFVITLEVPDGTFSSGANIRNRLEGVIMDSDEIDFQLSEVCYTKNEGPNALLKVLIIKGSGIALANPVYFRLTPLTVVDAIKKGVIGDFEVQNPFSPNRANYEDFDRTTLFATFNDTVSFRELKIPIVDDDIDEADEQVFIIFLEVTNATNFNKVNVNRNTSFGRIMDDETTCIGFEFKSYEVTEPNEAEELISNLVYLIREYNRKSEQTYSVDLTVGDPEGNFQPATIETSNTNQSFDYSFGLPDQTKVNVLFPPTVDRIPFVFSLNHDLAVEGTETFRATSAQVTPSGDFPVFQTPAGITAFSSTLIHIIDNNELRVGFEELNYTVSESAGTVEVCVIVISPPPTEDLDITVALSPSTMDGTAEAGSDFTQLRELLSISLLFPSSPGSPTAGPRRECFDVTITDDNLFENTESFSLLLQEDIFAQQTGATINPNQTEILILDDDEVVIGFLSENYSVNESDGTASIEFGIITGSLETDISVQLSYSDVSALSGSDYSSSARVYSLTGRETVTVDIGIIEDCKFEQTEVFNASLSFIVVPPHVTLKPDRTEINITDADVCPIGSYLARTSPGNTVCQPCPDNSVSIMPNSAVCECYQGYHRSSLEAIHLPCTRPPSACRNLIVLQKRTRANTITVRWERPLITGRDDYYYDIFYSDPDLPGRFKKHNLNAFIKHYPLVTYSVSGLRPLTGYTIRVVSQNGVSDQDPQGEEGRRCEVSETTGDISAQPPSSVTSFCSVIVWKPPTQAYGVITGYDVSFSPPGEDNGVIVSKNRNELFHVVRASELPPRQGDILVKVRARTVSHNGSWSDAIPLNCTGIDGDSTCPGF